MEEPVQISLPDGSRPGPATSRALVAPGPGDLRA